MDPLRNFGFLLRELSTKYVLRFEQHARELGLTLPQCKALVWLENNQGLNQAKLGEIADIEPMSLVRILDRMEAGGVLQRRADPEDRRVRRVYLTAKAKPLLEEIWRISDMTRAETFGDLNRDDRLALLRMMQKMYENVCSAEGQPPETGPGVSRKAAARSTGTATPKRRARR